MLALAATMMSAVLAAIAPVTLPISGTLSNRSDLAVQTVPMHVEIVDEKGQVLWQNSDREPVMVTVRNGAYSLALGDRNQKNMQVLTPDIFKENTNYYVRMKSPGKRTKSTVMIPSHIHRPLLATPTTPEKRGTIRSARTLEMGKFVLE